MNTNDFDFNLPEELIAQTPIKNRSESKLLVLDKETGEITHKTFSNIIEYLDDNDVLVLNDTKVIPARIFGNKEETNAKIEMLLLKDLGNNIYEVLVKPARRIKIGDVVSFNEGMLRCKCVETFTEGLAHFEMIYDGILFEILEKIGQMPLPPYIREKLDDKDRYQTVYALNQGSAAAPTAGLHFTKELLQKIKEKNIIITYVTLHVGLGTFRPVSVDNVLEHKMHEEEYFVSKETADILNNAIKNNKRIIAVGTTSTRTLESAYDNGFKESHGNTSIFIYPGYKFKVVNAQITNFHLPKSTLMMLVSALSSKEKILNAYNEAIKERYRFFSFGDSMFIK
ncbi:MAG: tRNA preQ1(34) S-adenosylmethionine ribosyltransferase-isomerase QueA [bacterium]